MQDFEQLGAFYLGKRKESASDTITDELLLYDAKDLTTHGVILGMTGSGKTGLALALIEEAAIDGIPVIAIDPKGDLGNLLLAFPALSAADFRPWIDEAEAARKGLDPDTHAQLTAELWKSGLAAWGQEPSRIQKYVDAVDLAIYTPGNTAGRPLQILRSFAAPPAALLDDSTALRDRIGSAVSGLLGLLGIDADPLQSREHILLANLLERAWREGRDLDLPGLIAAIQKPPFDRIGVFDLESFYPAKERTALAMALNNLLASPGFSAWMEGEPLDIASLLHTAEGKARVSVLSIAHLSDAERMFFVSLLLNEILAWVRTQSGSNSLRALVYMDEIFGYFPPTANPPSKIPMLTLLKQARAFGVGMLLSTQNPVDLDYKGLANCGTWFIGRLQTERDQARVMDGLESVGSDFDRAQTAALMASLRSRVFLMRNVHDDAPMLFHTRWVMSYLRGPMTLPQIRTLSARSTQPPVAAVRAAHPTSTAGSTTARRPVVPVGLTEHFLSPRTASTKVLYQPLLLGASKLHFVQAKAGIDTWSAFHHLAAWSEDGSTVEWEEATAHGELVPGLDSSPLPDAQFAELPAAVTNPRAIETWKKSLAAFLYQSVQLELFACPAWKLTSTPGETEGDFRTRVTQVAREHRDAEVEKLRAKYATRATALQDQIRRAEEKVAREKEQYGQQKLQTAISFGSTLLGAFMGRKVATTANVSRAATSMKSAGRISKARGDIERAGESLDVLMQRWRDLDAALERDVEELTGSIEAKASTLERVALRPRKSDIAIGDLAVVWAPYAHAAGGFLEPA